MFIGIWEAFYLLELLPVMRKENKENEQYTL